MTSLIAVLGVVLAAVQPQTYTARQIDPDQAEEDVSLLIGVMEAHHPGYRRYRTQEQLEDAAGKLRDAIANDGTDLAMYLAVTRFLADIRCEHTEAELPTPLADWRGLNPTMLPLRFAWVEGRAIVTASANETVMLGDEILSINGVAMRTAFEEVSPLIAVDGQTDHTKVSLFAGSDDIGLTVFDVYFPLLHGFTPDFELALSDPRGMERVVRVAAISEADSNALDASEGGYANFSEEGSVRWRLLDDRTALLDVETFVNYRTPVDPSSVYGPVFAAIHASGAKRLIVDLRRCGGGSVDAAHGLLSRLITAPICLAGPVRIRTFEFDPQVRPFLSTWNEEVFNLPAELFTPDGSFYTVDPSLAGGRYTLEPSADAWTGELVVLAGHFNASGSTNMLAELREQRELTIVGQPTGGSAEGCTAGQILTLTLPHSQIPVRVPLLWTRNCTKDFELGMGVAPDVVARPSVDGVRAGRDEALEAALAL